MSEFKVLWKILEKMGYPNDELHEIASMVNYDMDNFLKDLIKTFGKFDGLEIISDSLDNLKNNGDSILVKSRFSEKEFYVLKIREVFLHDPDIPFGYVEIRGSFDDSVILLGDDDKEVQTKVGELADNLDMGEWGDFDDLMGSIKGICSRYIFDRCGFHIEMV